MKYVGVVIGLYIIFCSRTISSDVASNINTADNSTLLPEGESGNVVKEAEQNANLFIDKLIQMENRIAQLEEKLRQSETKVSSLRSDIDFFNPTIEHGYIDMNIVNWEDAVFNALNEDVSVTFRAGETIGAYSTWTFFLSQENNETVTVNLALQQESYDKGALYVGFTLYVINEEDNVAVTQSLKPSNILESGRQTLFLPGVLIVSEISNPVNKLLKNGMLRLRLRIDLIANGRKLYNPEFGPEPPAKDTQTVLFEVEKLKEKLQNSNNMTVSDPSGNGTLKSIAFTRFQLTHPWGKVTGWEVILKVDSISKLFTLFLSMDGSGGEGSQLFASFKLKLSLKGSKELVLTKDTPLHDYVGKGIFLELMQVEELEALLRKYQEDALEFKLYLSVYGKNARYYVHL